MENRKWNVVATLVVVLTLAVTFTAILSLRAGSINFAEFQQAISTMLLPMMGYLARMLSSEQKP